jgi:hypothetical protein
MEKPIRMKIERAKHWLLYIQLLMVMVNTKKDFETRPVCL